MFTRMHRIWRLLPVGVTAVLAGAVALPSAAIGATSSPGVTFTKLALLNGWEASPFGTASPAVAVISGIVYFRGAISASSGDMNDVAFVLPRGFRPSKFVNIPVDMCNATPGELNIAPTGVTQVISDGANANATCFTSLEGASFAASAASFSQLRLQAGWKEFGSFFRKGAVRLSGGFVRFEGEIMPTGKNTVAFILPAKFRPSSTVRILINLCTGEMGQLSITAKGVARVQSEPGQSFAIKCGTSLEGAAFARSPKSFTALKLKNGWQNFPSGTAKAAARVISGIVHFRGAIRTSGTNPVPFILPTALRPHHTVYVTVSLCKGINGRLEIVPSGGVVVQPENNDFTDAKCLASLDGVSFVR